MATPPSTNDTAPDALPSASSKARELYARKFEASDLRRAFEKLDVRRDGIIDVHELRHVLQRLGYRLSKAAAEEIVWEVDEDCDGGVTWDEFQRMYLRGRGDVAGFEPQRLFNIVLFIMHDKEERGRLPIHRAMEVLYLQHGRDGLDEQLQRVFGTCDMTTGRSLSMEEFLDCLLASQVRAMYQANKLGRVVTLRHGEGHQRQRAD